MKWGMEIEEVEAVLDKIWDLHDKLSDAIHSISRTHFLNSTKSLKNPDFFNNNNKPPHFSDNGFVFVKDFSAISEAKSLNSIRSALENLEDQLQFFHTVQAQQRSERDAAIARLEQSRMILALRLAEHHGKKYKVIDEAINFVGDVRDASYFTGPENVCNPHPTAPTEHCLPHKGKGISSNVVARVLFSGFDSAKKTLQLDKMGGVFGNAALFALSMLALLHLHQVTNKADIDNLNIGLKHARIGKKSSRLDGCLDVRLARG